MGDFFKLISDVLVQHGIGVVVILVLCYISYKIITHILQQSDNILERANQAQEAWRKVIEEHSSQAKEFHSQVREAHDYQRREHNEILDGMKIVNLALKEIELTLGRINGYKQ